jgi:hypothetical protein
MLEKKIMEFYVLVFMLSLTSFALAIIVYGFCLKVFGMRSLFGKIAPWVLIPLIVISYDFMLLARQGVSRIVLSLIPVAAVAGLVLYYKIAHGSDDLLEPHEMAAQKKVSKKSLKHAEKVRQREEKRQEEIARRLEKTKK